MAKRETRSSSSPHIPLEIIEVIVSKLSSVKSLLRFKTVSKSWNTMIQNHLQNSPNNLFLCKYRNYSKGGFSLVKLEGPKFQDERILEISRNEGDTILCECNGVLLLGDSWSNCTKYVLWNPSTRSHMHLESPFAYFNDYSVNRGICYDPRTNDFKVVLISRERYAIYSCNNDSWMEKKLGTEYCDTYRSGIYADGATYWLLRHYNGTNTEIVYFDPVIDELKTLQKPEQLPSDDDDDNYLFISLTCLRGKLCLYCDDYKTRKIQIWNTEHVGQNHNWKELITFEDSKTWCWFRAPKPLCFVENKIVIRLNGDRLVYYSPSKKTFEEFEEIATDKKASLPYRSSLHFPTGVKTETRSIS